MEYTVRMQKQKIITSKDIQCLSDLARIRLSETEKTEFEKGLEKIIVYVSQLSEVPTDKVAPTWQVLPVTNVFRDDEVGKDTDRDEILDNAPERDDRFFKVPKII